MRAVVQRVVSAHVEAHGETSGAIERGLLVYLGVGRGDAEKDRAYILRKVVSLRIFADESGKMTKSVVDVGGSLLIVSQFTLYGDVTRGARPSFDGAMPPVEARAAYDAFVRDASAVLPVATGVFRADMKVVSVGDGPVTILLDSSSPSPARWSDTSAVTEPEQSPLVEPSTEPASAPESPATSEPAPEPAPREQPGPTGDAVFEAMWNKVLETWDEDKIHNAVLEYSVANERLPDLAGRYRALSEDPAKAERAKKRLDAIIVAATSLMMSMRTPGSTKVPLSITLSVAGLFFCAVLFVWYAMIHR